ncbi:type II secretion system protein N [Niveibacterium sp. COAC-50]|uniref:type II secretion system protein N n=1 Tax=Niveibacterium sp. COAC-50 TaxID=2729384 RepID=UPI001555C5F4
MPALPIRRLQSIAPAAGTGLLWLAAIALWAWFAASWYWRLSAPPAASAPNQLATDPSTAAREIGTRHLFGEVIVQQQVATASRYTLVGVAAHSRKSPGWAVIAEDGKPAQGFVLGDEIAPGVKLVSVLPDSVEIERSGARERIMLSEAPRQAGGATPPPAAAPGLPPQLQYQVNQAGGQPPGMQPQRGAPGMAGEAPQVQPVSSPENQPNP